MTLTVICAYCGKELPSFQAFKRLLRFYCSAGCMAKAAWHIEPTP